MSYAVRIDGNGWRAINGPNEVGPGEVYSEFEPAHTISKIKAEKWDAIKQERDRRGESGGFNVDNKWFHSDQKSRSQQQDNEATGQNLVPVQWKTMDGTFVSMTPDLAAQIRQVRMENDRAIFAAAEAHRKAMEECDDPAAYDFSGSWPMTFAESKERQQ